jgi:hypothetical protein
VVGDHQTLLRKYCVGKVIAAVGMIETATVARTFPTRLETLASLGHGKLKNACPVEDKWVVRKLPAQFFKESLKRRESTAGAPLRVSPSILLNLWV